jgi:hypothetical protein
MTDPATTEAMVVRALTSWGLSRNAVASEFGVSGSQISYIRTGARHASIRPDLPRWRSCLHCVHWDEARCTLGFPEPAAGEFLWAATECSAYMRPKP